ncbi:hypothetical protein PanWU01x14_121250, partial [Parasponia andersonii]
PHTLHNSITQQLNIPTGKRLQVGNCSHSQLLRLHGSGNGQSRVLCPRRLQIDHDPDIDPMKNRVEGLPRILGVNPNRVQERDFPRSKRLLKQGRARRSEKCTDIRPNRENLRPFEARDRLRGQTQHVPGVLAVPDDPESGFIDGHHTPKGLDMAAPLDFRQVSGNLLLRDRLCGGSNRL